MMSLEDRIYKYLKFYKQTPAGLRKVIAVFYNLIPNPIRYGSHYRRFQELVNESKKWTRHQIEQYQVQQINSLLEISKKNVPYYQKTLKSLKLPIKSLKEFADSVPFVTKEELRGHYQDFINPGIPESKTLVCATGGTTAEPLKIRYEKGVNRTKELVFMNDQWSRIGFKDNDLRVIFRSTLVRGRAQRKHWSFDPIKNRYYFSSFDLSDDIIDQYIARMNQIKPKFLHVYPSVLTIIASYMKKKRISCDFVQGIFSGSENTFPSQIELFKEVFNARIFRWYGLAEGSALAGSCEYNYYYHCYPSYSFTELIDKNGGQVRDLDKTGEIVGTSFHNYAMPLIRYKTADFAVYGGEQCRECGRIGLLFKEINGRAQEVIFDKSGNRYSLGPFIFGIHEEFWSNVKAIQFEQFEKGKLVLRAVSNNVGYKNLEQYLKEKFIPRFSNNFDVEIIPVDNIKRTNTGKHRYLIQHIG